MARLSAWALALVPLVHVALAQDPCAAIGGQKWVAPAALRACFQSFPVNQTTKENILDVTRKTLAFHTSTSYQIRAPQPYTADVHEDLLADIARISKTEYASEYEFHIDLSRSFKRLNDGHAVWIDACYDSAFLNFLPIPLTLLTDNFGIQTVHIVPEAFAVATAEFPDQVDFWQNALPGNLKGQLASLSGATVLLIDDQPPFQAVDANAAIAGSFQALGTRQNGFFSSYVRSTASFNYDMGQFAQQTLPLSDQVTITIKRVNSTKIERITIPYRARIDGALEFTNAATYRANNCLAIDGTNGIDFNNQAPIPSTADKFKQAPVPKRTKELLNVALDTVPLSDIVLPPELQPGLPALNGSFGVGTFYMQPDGITGVLALGAFSGGADFDTLERSLLTGLLNLKDLGATQLIVDVSNNGGGYICLAHWLHRIIIGPKDTTVPNAGLETTVRAGPLAQEIVQQIIDNDLDPNQNLLYNPRKWANASGVDFPATRNWLRPPVTVTINGKPDAFSERLGQECQPSRFTSTPPDVQLFAPAKIAIVSNGRCASSCSLFSITMSKEEGVKTVVVGGNNTVKQAYCGTVGGQSTDFWTIDSQIKTAQLKNNPLAPPDLLVNGVQGLTWRLGFGIDKTKEPEEWQDHPADLNLPLTPELVNNPTAIWTEVAARLFK